MNAQQTHGSDAPPTGFSHIDRMMAEARQTVKARGFRPPQLPPYVPTPETLDFDERLDAAVSKSELLLKQALEQLAKPCVAPDELTPEELDEEEQSAAFDAEYSRKNQIVDQHMKRNQKLFDNVMSTMNDMETKGIGLPDCSDIIDPSPFRTAGSFMPSASHAHDGLCPISECPLVEKKKQASTSSSTGGQVGVTPSDASPEGMTRAQAAQWAAKATEATKRREAMASTHELTSPSPVEASAYAGISRGYRSLRSSIKKPTKKKPEQETRDAKQKVKWHRVAGTNFQCSWPAPAVFGLIALMLVSR